MSSVNKTEEWKEVHLRPRTVRAKALCQEESRRGQGLQVERVWLEQRERRKADPGTVKRAEGDKPLGPSRSLGAFRAGAVSEV